jgi:UDP-glucose:(heptosyl)LPS alpha-1,3-glucosyltransferase
MHILLTIPHFHAAAGGAEAYAVTVVRGLLERGHQIEVVAEDGSELPDVPLHLGPLGETTARIRELRKPDIVVDWGLNVPAHLHRLGGGTHAGFLPYSLEAYPQPQRAVKSVWYNVAPKHQREIQRERELLQIPGTHVLAVSQFVADQVPAAADLPADRIHVLHNGVDSTRFTPQNHNSDTVTFLFVAHNLRLKNLALLRRVFPAQAKLIVLGKRKPDFTAPWLHYAGSSNSPEQFYADADVLLHPTFYDACANVVLEAIASGLPVLSSDCNGSAELLPPDWVLPLDDDAWRQAILALADDCELRKSRAETARKLAVQNDIQAYIPRFEAILQRCAPCKT